MGKCQYKDLLDKRDSNEMAKSAIQYKVGTPAYTQCWTTTDYFRDPSLILPSVRANMRKGMERSIAKTIVLIS